MRIVVLDKASVGEDLPLDVLYRFGQVDVYDSSTPDEVKIRISDADVVILNKIKLTKDIFEAAKRLKLVCIFATGYDNIDISCAREKGIAVCNVPGYSTDSVALYTVATVLALISKLFEYNSFVRSGEYTQSGSPNKLTPVYHEVSGKVWGIVGYGNIGRAVARIAEALGARVIVYKRNPVDDAQCVDIDALCKESDIITLHCPLNEESRQLIDRRRLSFMKPDVVLVNEARGAVVDEKAIADAIITGKIKAFGSDVFSVEPFGMDHPFFNIKDHPGVILTPHCAWGAYESRVRCINIIADNIQAFIDGKMQNRVDK